jgi:signal transduction histidine kinase
MAGAGSAGSEGGGLGVDVIMRLLRSVDGTIDVASTPGEGTRIVLTIPPRRGDGGVAEP